MPLLRSQTALWLVHVCVHAKFSCNSRWQLSYLHAFSCSHIVQHFVFQLDRLQQLSGSRKDSSQDSHKRGHAAANACLQCTMMLVLLVESWLQLRFAV
jgi:hypothetical protein